MSITGFLLGLALILLGVAATVAVNEWRARPHRPVTHPPGDDECEVCAEAATRVIVSDETDAHEAEIRRLGGFSAMAAYYCDEHAPERAQPIG